MSDSIIEVLQKFWVAKIKQNQLLMEVLNDVYISYEVNVTYPAILLDNWRYSAYSHALGNKAYKIGFDIYFMANDSSSLLSVTNKFNDTFEKVVDNLQNDNLTLEKNLQLIALDVSALKYSNFLYAKDEIDGSMQVNCIVQEV